MSGVGITYLWTNKKFPSFIRLEGRRGDYEVYVPERTCRNENGSNIFANFVCSECGLHIHKPNIGRSYVDENGKRWYATSSEHALNYCPNCGAKVVDS